MTKIWFTTASIVGWAASFCTVSSFSIHPATVGSPRSIHSLQPRSVHRRSHGVEPSSRMYIASIHSALYAQLNDNDEDDKEKDSVMTTMTVDKSPSTPTTTNHRKPSMDPTLVFFSWLQDNQITTKPVILLASTALSLLLLLSSPLSSWAAMSGGRMGGSFAPSSHSSSGRSRSYSSPSRGSPSSGSRSGYSRSYSSPRRSPSSGSSSVYSRSYSSPSSGSPSSTPSRSVYSRSYSSPRRSPSSGSSSGYSPSYSSPSRGSPSSNPSSSGYSPSYSPPRRGSPSPSISPSRAGYSQGSSSGYSPGYETGYLSPPSVSIISPPSVSILSPPSVSIISPPSVSIISPPGASIMSPNPVVSQPLYNGGTGVMTYTQLGFFELFLIGGLFIGIRRAKLLSQEEEGNTFSSWSRAAPPFLGSGTSVLLLSVALEVPNRDDSQSVLSVLHRLATTARTDSRVGISNLTSQVALELLRRKSSIVSASAKYQHFQDRTKAQQEFQTIAIKERSKFEMETVSNYGGVDYSNKDNQRLLTGDRSSQATMAVVTLIMAIYGDFSTKLSPIRYMADVEEALRKIAADVKVNDVLESCEILWTPEDRSETLTLQDVVADYPELHSV